MRHKVNLSYTVIVVCLFISILIQVQALVRIIEQQQEIEVLQKQTKHISQQGKDLSNQTVFLSGRNIYYSKCVAYLFSKYTFSQQPIFIKDIKTCEVQ